MTGLSCAAPGQCALAGYYASNYYGEYSGTNAAVPFVATEVKGKWSAAQERPGPGANGRTGIVEINALSCGSPGNCVAGGSYTYERVNLGSSDGTVYPQAFVLTETHGVWGQTEEVPGLGSLRPKDSEIAFMSCAAPRSHLRCTAIGDYVTKAEFSGLFTTST